INTSTPTQALHVIGNILASGTITPSDVRFKENVKNLNHSLEKIQNLRGVSYNHKAKFIKSHGLKEGNQIGFIAQELEKIFPEFVETGSDGYKAVDYAKLTPVLVEAIKEQQNEIAELKKQNQKLTEKTSEIDALKAEIESIKSLLKPEQNIGKK
ncbi:MAG: tail fiber domain-containing protein, partial [Saprospiraceae bacterium]